MFEGWLHLMHPSQQSWERCWRSDPGTSELGKGLGDGIRGFRLAITEVPESTDAKLPKPEVCARTSGTGLVVGFLSF